MGATIKAVAGYENPEGSVERGKGVEGVGVSHVSNYNDLRG